MLLLTGSGEMKRMTKVERLLRDQEWIRRREFFSDKKRAKALRVLRRNAQKAFDMHPLRKQYDGKRNSGSKSSEFDWRFLSTQRYWDDSRLESQSMELLLRLG